MDRLLDFNYVISVVSHTAMLVLLLAASADIWTTLRALSMGFREANPIVAFFMRTTGTGWVYLKLAVTVAAGFYGIDQGHDVWVYIGATAILALAFHNYWVTRNV